MVAVAIRADDLVGIGLGLVETALLPAGNDLRVQSHHSRPKPIDSCIHRAKLLTSGVVSLGPLWERIN